MIILGPVKLFAVPGCAYALRRSSGGVVVQLDGGDGLTRDQWRQFVEAIDSAWQALSRECACGHAYAAHGESSPHACAHSSGCCGCRCFSESAAQCRGEGESKML